MLYFEYMGVYCYETVVTVTTDIYKNKMMSTYTQIIFQ